MSRSRVLFTCITLLLVLATSAIAAKGGGKVVGTYDVTPLFGWLYPAGGDWPGEGQESRKKPVTVFFQPIVLQLDYFISKLPNGASCFGEAHFSATGSAISISQDRQGEARVVYWFRGYGEGGPGGSEVKYMLAMFGSFDGVWRPPNKGDSTILNLSEWRMGTENKKHRGTACTGSSPFAETMTVTRTN